MHKKLVVAVMLLFCCNTLLSVFSSCKRKPRGIYDRCATSCYTLVSASIKLFGGPGTKVLEAPYSTKATDLVMQVKLEGTVSTFCYKKTPTRNLSLFSTAIAYVAAPSCPILQRNDSVVSYNIYSSNAYDAQHPAGSSLNDIITTDDIPTRTLYTNSLVCIMMVDKAPADTGSHIFTIELIQKDGDVLKLNTPTIKLLK